MPDNWAALKTWLEAQQAAAREAASQASAALRCLTVVTTSERDWNAAAKTFDEAHSQYVTLNRVVQKMRELERGSSDA